MSLERSSRTFDKQELALLNEVRRLRQKLAIENRNKKPPVNYDSTWKCRGKCFSEELVYFISYLVMSLKIDSLETFNMCICDISVCMYWYLNKCNTKSDRLWSFSQERNIENLSLRRIGPSTIPLHLSLSLATLVASVHGGWFYLITCSSD